MSIPFVLKAGKSPDHKMSGKVRQVQWKLSVEFSINVRYGEYSTSPAVLN